MHMKHISKFSKNNAKNVSETYLYVFKLIKDYTFYSDTDSCKKLSCYSSDLVAQFKSNFDLPILNF